MLQPTPTRGTGATWVGAVYADKQRRRLLVAIFLLLVAMTAFLVRERGAWFGSDNDEMAAADSEQYASTPITSEPTLPVAEAKPAVVSQSASVTANHTPSGHAHDNSRRASNPVKRESTRSQGRVSATSSSGTSSATWGPATTAAQRAGTSGQAQAHRETVSYPLLTGAMAVQGSVLLQAMIAADGAVEEMRVISGPTILVSAARQAVQQWRFKPYLVNGKAVETYARVTVNFTIDVSNTEARYHVNSVTATGAF
jgi:TonB family protein